MTRRQIVDILPKEPGTFTLGEKAHRHLIRVLRMKSGDTITLFDRNGFEAQAKIDEISKDSVICLLEQPQHIDREPKRKVTLAFALTKGVKPDLVLQKGTELGVSKFCIFIAERSVSRPAPGKIDDKLKRWQKIIDAACEQSGRTKTPTIHFFSTFSTLLLDRNEKARFCLSPDATESVVQKSADAPDSVALLIGPEGGLTSDEQALAISNNFTPINMGRCILRAETAAIAAVVPFILDKNG
jgi:16S rRNA (uracil1498-N3)-methyltransferase